MLVYPGPINEIYLSSDAHVHRDKSSNNQVTIFLQYSFLKKVLLEI